MPSSARLESQRRDLGQTNLSQLPAEIWGGIARELPTGDLLNVRRVNKHCALTVSALHVDGLQIPCADASSNARPSNSVSDYLRYAPRAKSALWRGLVQKQRILIPPGALIQAQNAPKGLFFEDRPFGRVLQADPTSDTGLFAQVVSSAEAADPAWPEGATLRSRRIVAIYASHSVDFR